MIKKLKEHGFCSLIPQLLKTHSHDSREASVIAMQNMLGFCKTDFHSAAITTVLSSLNVIFVFLFLKDVKYSIYLTCFVLE